MLAKFYRVFENSTGVFWNLYVKNYTDLFCFQTNYNKLPLAVVNNQLRFMNALHYHQTNITIPQETENLKTFMISSVP